MAHSPTGQPRPPAGRLRAAITGLALPLPLEVLLFRAMNAHGIDGRHERLVYAWEIAIQIAASATWAVCRHLGLRSAAVDEVMPKLTRPMFGHWLELLRACRALLANRSDAAAVGMRPLLDGLEAKYATDRRLEALAARIRALPKRNAKVGGGTLGALLDAIPSYRNETRGHGEPDTDFREGGLDALLEGLLAFLEVAPPLGGFRVVVVERIEDLGDRRTIELLSMEGGQPLAESRAVSPEMSGALVPGRPYLHLEPDLFVSLFPVAAASRGQDGWVLGWLKQQVRVPTLSFESSLGGAFAVLVEGDDYLPLVRSGVVQEEELAEGDLDHDPWRGLLAYDEEHASLFFGRDALTVEILSRLTERRAAVLCGASGSGKSSLMRAGLLPRLRGQLKEQGRDLVTLVMVPGARPIAALRDAVRTAGTGDAAAMSRWSREVDHLLGNDASMIGPDALVHLVRGLAASGAHVLVLVDQLEEASTLCTDPSERARFFDLLTTAASVQTESVSIVTTLRADRVDAVLEHAGMRALLQRAIEPVGAMTRDELVEVIKRPLRGRRAEIEGGLAERILADVGDEPGGLALVSQLLAVLWEERGRFGGRLTLQGYESVGEVTGVLGRQGDEARAEATRDSPERAAQLDQILLRLARRGDDGTFTRRRLPLGSLIETLSLSREGLDRFVDPFVRRRLLVAGSSGADELEVAHEALLRGWPHLKQLLEREGEVTALRQDVERSANAWESSSHRSELWSDATSNLKRAEELLASGRLQLPPRERRFLDASRRAVTIARVLTRAAVAMIAILLVLSGILGWRASRSAALARISEREAKSRSRDAYIAEARALSASPLDRKDAPLAALRALALERSLDSPIGAATRLAVTSSAYAGRRYTENMVFESGGPFEDAALSPDGRRLASVGDRNAIRIWDVETGGPPKDWLFNPQHRGHDVPPESIRWSPSGGLVAATSVDLLEIRDADAERVAGQVQSSPGDEFIYWTASADFRRFAAVTRRSFGVAAWSVGPDGTVVPSGFDHAGVLSPALSDDGRLIAYAIATPARPPRAREIASHIDEVATGKSIALLQDYQLITAVFSKDATRLLTTHPAESSQADLWDVTSGKRLFSLRHGGRVRRGAFSPDGARLATTSDDKTLRVWNATTGEPVAVCLHDEPVRRVAFSPDGSKIATSTSENQIRVWSASDGRLIDELDGHTNEITALAFDARGSSLLSASRDHTATKWSLIGARLVRAFGWAADVVRLRGVANGGQLAVFSENEIRLIDAVSGTTTSMDAPGQLAPAFEASASRAGAFDTLVLAAGSDGSLVTWDRATGKELSRVRRGATDGKNIFIAERAPVFLSCAPDRCEVVDARGSVLSSMSPREGVDSRAISANGQVVALRGKAGPCRFFDARAKDGTLLGAIDDDGVSVLSADGSRAAMTSRGSTRLFATAGGVRIAVLEGELEQFARDGSLLVTGAILPAVGAREGSSTGALTQRRRFYDARTGALLSTVDAIAATAHARLDALSATGASFAIAEDKSVRIFATKTGVMVARLDGHTEPIKRVAFSPDGELVATASEDRTARVWSARTGDLLVVMDHRSTVDEVSFLADGAHVVTEEIPARIGHIWDVSWEHALATACKVRKGRPHFAEVEGVCPK